MSRRISPVPLTPVFVVLGLALIAWYVSSQPARLGDDQIINREFLGDRLQQHIKISLVSFGAAALIGIPVGVLLAQANGIVRAPFFAVANLGQSLPSPALLAIAFTYLGLGFKPTVLALVLYGLLPILRNTTIGLATVDPAVTEASRGMGLTWGQTLVRVQVPLALPAIFAGLRTALVLIIGTATLANFIGGGGLGDVIAAGITSGRDRIVLTGAGMVAALALVADWLLSAVQRLLEPKV